ncbi:unnamed protein product [Ranitomeya imitator]|uniref:Uncharacterized protein n=1 Tax=Ranitomeya imitator TaxID=111125 RepID=A0ABN9L4D3_9NEOB|nr:unnamed protein product [Ranitomeya imitator]
MGYVAGYMCELKPCCRTPINTETVPTSAVQPPRLTLVCVFIHSKTFPRTKARATSMEDMVPRYVQAGDRNAVHPLCKYLLIRSYKRRPVFTRKKTNSTYLHSAVCPLPSGSCTDCWP